MTVKESELLRAIASLQATASGKISILGDTLTVGLGSNGYSDRDRDSIGTAELQPLG